MNPALPIANEAEFQQWLLLVLQAQRKKLPKFNEDISGQKQKRKPRTLHQRIVGARALEFLYRRESPSHATSNPQSRRSEARTALNEMKRLQDFSQVTTNSWTK